MTSWVPYKDSVDAPGFYEELFPCRESGTTPDIYAELSPYLEKLCTVSCP
jgi:hypothetical protein